jgi:hypothetical protein
LHPPLLAIILFGSSVTAPGMLGDFTNSFQTFA